MINRDDIEAGDKCFTRDGGCLVARTRGEDLLLGSENFTYWESDGQCSSFHDHPLDIIRIEKAPKPVVEEVYLCSQGNGWVTGCGSHGWQHAIKLTIINGKLEKAEQVK